MHPLRESFAVVVGAPCGVGALFVAGCWLFYVLGNGLVPGALALGTVPVALLLIPAGIALPGVEKRVAAAVLAILAVDVGFAAWRVGGVWTDGPIAACVDGVCGGPAPFFGSLVREDESAYAGIALTSAMGMLSARESAVIRESARARYDALASLRDGQEGPNALLMSSTGDRVESLMWMPPLGDHVPAIVFLHGYGGLLTPYVSSLLEADALKSYAIVAPALDNTGAWWTDEGKAVVTRTLDTLPARIDRDRVVLVGLSNGAVGATAIASDVVLARRFRAVVALVGLGQVADFGVLEIPGLVIAGNADERFPIGFMREATRAQSSDGAEVTFVGLDADHMALFTHTSAVDDAIASFIAGR